MSAAPARPLQLLLVDDPVIKQDPQWITVPVIVFTTSDQPDDITASYTAHANAYVTKPLDLDDLDRAVNDIDAFYGELAVRAPATATLNPDISPRSTDQRHR